MEMYHLFPLRTSSSQGVRALNKSITLLWLIAAVDYCHQCAVLVLI